ncbi:MAG: hypothetical protein J6C37_01250 [Roseburia sp.]|nr:hypothetical protein [Roseburia sp.]
MARKVTAKNGGVKAAAKTTEAKVNGVKAAEEAVEVKATEEKATEVKAAGTEEVAAEKEEAAAKKTTTAKKTVQKETKAVTAKKAEKEELKPEVYLQFQGNEAVVEGLIEKAKELYVAEGHRISSIKSLQMYLKPEEYAAYYVINGKFSGRLDLF